MFNQNVISPKCIACAQVITSSDDVTHLINEHFNIGIISHVLFQYSSFKLTFIICKIIEFKFAYHFQVGKHT